jgi:hypothetical protein
MLERDMIVEVETKESVAQYIGRLQDIGLGQDCLDHGITAPENIDYEKTCEELSEALTPVTDETHYACIDGRHTICNSDGSPREVRRHFVGGTGCVLSIALNGDAALVDTFHDGTIGEHNRYIESVIQQRTHIARSAHLGGCGGVRGEVADNYAIANEPKILETVKMLLDIPEIAEFSSARFDQAQAAMIQHTAGHTSEYFEIDGWNEKKFVEGVQKQEPKGCEDLETAPDLHHGHKEKGIAIVIDDEQTLDIDDYFVVDIRACSDVANALSGQRGDEGYNQLFMASLAKHIATAHRLCGQNMPLYIVSSRS